MTGVAALTCPQCGAPVRVTAAGRTLSVICGGCGSTLDAATPELRLLAERATALAVPEIALGTRGVLDGVEWEIVGYLERSAYGEGWREYLLFNPWEAFAWLVDSGDFKLGRPLLAEPETQGRTAAVAGNVWHGRARYESKVTLALGEFPWRVETGEAVSVAEYDRGDTTLSRENNAEETSWTLLVPLQPHDVAAAFGVAERTPPPAPQPPQATLWPQMLLIAALAFAVILLINGIYGQGRPVRVAELQVPVGAGTISTSAGPIELPPGRNFVVISAVPQGNGLENEWLDLDYTLVNRRTQASYPVGAVAERYRGVDADGNWSEGDERPRTSLAGIPGGRYDLVVEASGQRWQPPPSPYGPQASTLPGLDQPAVHSISIAISAGGTDGGMTMLAAALLFGWPILLLFYAFEGNNRTEEDEW